MQSDLRKMCRYSELTKSKPVRVNSYMYYCFNVRHCGYSQVTDSNVTVTKVWRLRKTVVFEKTNIPKMFTNNEKLKYIVGPVQHRL